MKLLLLILSISISGCYSKFKDEQEELQKDISKLYQKVISLETERDRKLYRSKCEALAAALPLNNPRTSVKIFYARDLCYVEAGMYTLATFYYSSMHFYKEN